MASPIVYRQESAEAGDTTVTIQFAVGATGAVGAIQGGGKRAKEFRRATPVVRDSAGVYSIFLKEAWLALLGSRAEILAGVAYAATDGWDGRITTNSVSASPPKVVVTFTRPDTGATTDPASGAIASVTLRLKRFSPL
jgi:hypothetical protein